MIVCYLVLGSQGARLLVSAIFILLNTDLPFSVWFSRTTLERLHEVQ